MQNKIKLIGLPYAGGNKFSFNGFYRCFDKQVEALTLELPGHGKRIVEPLLYKIEDMVEDLYRQISPHLGSEYVLYGHSMGGILGNYLIRRISEQNKRLPLFFFITGCAAPKYRHKDIVLHVLSMSELKTELQKLGGFPEEILQNDELMDFVLPIIHADIQALETFDYLSAQDKHTVPLIAIAGDNENISDEQLNGWELETSNNFEAYRLPGNHFFILDHFDTLAQKIVEKMEKYRSRLYAASR